MSNLELIKKIRQATGAGILAVKQALDQARGDEKQTLELLRKSGAAKAVKKADRATSQGLIDIKISPDHKKGSIIQVNCETDFVARNEVFKNFVSELSVQNLESASAETEFNSRQKDLVLKLGENLTLGQAQILAGAYVSGYLHSNKKVGALVLFNQELPEETAHNIAMQVTAANPSYLKPEDVPVSVLEKEKEIYREQLAKEGKPENIVDNIIKGKLSKFYEENCLTLQLFIKDDKKRVGELLPEAVEIVKFVRSSL